MAAPPPAEHQALADAVTTANAGDRKGAVKVLDALLKDHPDSVDGHVLRGINRHFLGDDAGARDDLGWAFDASRVEVLKATTKDFQTVEMQTDTLDLTEQRIVGAAWLAVIEARAGDAAAARAAVERARGVFGDDPRLRAAEARAVLAAGDSDLAWKLLAAAADPPDTTDFVRSITSEMAAIDPAHAPASVFDGLAASGQWTAFYNRARGALGRKDYRACADAAREGLASFAEPQLLAVGYTCAARSDPAAAATWLVQLGGAGSADPADVLANATTLRTAGKVEEAIALLGAMPKKLAPDQARSRQTLLLEGYLQLGKLDDAVKISDGITAPASETRLAHALIEAKRLKEALAILEKACPALGSDPARPGCDQLLTWARAQ
jgi:tetratricopeptide (TPR) repeat protein